MINLEQYLNQGIESLVKDILRATLHNPKESAFFSRFALTAKRAERHRHEFEKDGEHIPSFLIASITGTCNLNCTGCYDRANQSCKSQVEMSSNEWQRVFTEAESIGISAILLAGGEPLMRPDVIEEAAKHPAILFPIFTNGTMLTGSFNLFEKYRNLIPIISIEGDETHTDARRGLGVFEQTATAMEKLKNKKLLFGASITVTSQNLSMVTSNDFIADLKEKGCKAVVFVEYVPVENPVVALNDNERALLDRRVDNLRETENMIIISFPGDEKQSGGCLAAGRGFFHINASGSAEPCPFSPYSDTSLKTVTLREALKSPLFVSLKENGLLEKEHTGGCALFEQATQVQNIIAK